MELGSYAKRRSLAETPSANSARRALCFTSARPCSVRAWASTGLQGGAPGALRRLSPVLPLLIGAVGQSASSLHESSVTLIDGSGHLWTL